jgi:sugar (pentulose or hexulose) kinase
VLGGGAADSDVTTQIIADVAGVPLTRVTYRDTSLLGAAILARALVEPDQDWRTLIETMLPAPQYVEPGAHATRYQDLYGHYIAALAGNERNPT